MSKAHPSSLALHLDRSTPAPAASPRWSQLADAAVEVALAAVDQGRTAAAAAELERALDDLLDAETDDLVELADAIQVVAEELVFVHALRDDEASAARVLARCRVALTSLGSDA